MQGTAHSYLSFMTPTHTISLDVVELVHSNIAQESHAPDRFSFSIDIFVISSALTII